MAANQVDLFVGYCLRRYTQPASLVLDVGCGPAPYRHWVSGHYVGLDVTDEPYGIDMPRSVDVVGSGMDLPLRAETFDLVFSKSAFFLIPDPLKALREIHRVLKPGGRVLLFDYNRRTQRQLQAREQIARPCWTQWQLRSLVRQAGFRNCELLVPKDRDVSGLEYWLRLVHQELFGIWAIVTGVK